jgi:hypothetical protein
MIWLIEEQVAYALGASVGDGRVMKQAENSARWRYLERRWPRRPWPGFLAMQRL